MIEAYPTLSVPEFTTVLIAKPGYSRAEKHDGIRDLRSLPSPSGRNDGLDKLGGFRAVGLNRRPDEPWGDCIPEAV